MPNFEDPVYTISVVSKELNIHPQTLRQYEKDGLIEPHRSEGGIRLYSQKDINKLKSIIKLIRDLGINRAGVDLILKFKDRTVMLERENMYLRAELSKYGGDSVSKTKTIPRKLSDDELLLE